MVRTSTDSDADTDSTISITLFGDQALTGQFPNHVTTGQFKLIGRGDNDLEQGQ